MIGLLGLGIMGCGIATNLRRAGRKVLAWNREPEPFAALEPLGVRRAMSPGEVATQCEIVLSILWDDGVSLRLLGEEAFVHARPGTLFVEMSTISPRGTRVLAERAAEAGVAFLAAPVTGSREAARDAKLSVLASGSPANLERARPVLAHVAASVTHVGERIDAAAHLKLGNNIVIAAIVTSLRDALDTATAGGVDRREALAMYVGTFARVAAMKEAPIANGDFTPHFAIAALAKDLRQALDAATDEGRRLPLTESLSRLVETAKTSDGGADIAKLATR